MGNASVANVKSGEYHFSISSVACQQHTYGILYIAELVLSLIIQRFLPLVKFEFVNDRF